RVDERREDLDRLVELARDPRLLAALDALAEVDRQALQHDRGSRHVLLERGADRLVAADEAAPAQLLEYRREESRRVAGARPGLRLEADSTRDGGPSRHHHEDHGRDAHDLHQYRLSAARPRGCELCFGGATRGYGLYSSAPVSQALFTGRRWRSLTVMPVHAAPG